MSWDPYAALGVAKGADADAIKRAYRKLAKTLHPDVNPDDEAAEKRFKQATAAFNLLSDPEKRGRYDRGEIDADGNEKAVFQGGFGGPSGGFGGGFGDRSRQKRPDVFEDLFDGMFGRSGGGGRGFGPSRGGDIRYRLDVDFLEAVNGARRRVSMADGRSLDLVIPAGVSSGQTLRLKAQGDPGAHGGPPGDALVEVTVGGHALFVRDGDNLRMDLRISLAEAVLGGKVAAPTPSGPVSLSVPAGSNSGDVLRLRGKGVQRKGAPGDLFARLLITLPDKSDDELQNFVKSWSAKDVEPPR
ncbi:MAG: DnaJ C-terminal domain-containing protein [Pseudomonadota bacterium]